MAAMSTSPMNLNMIDSNFQVDKLTNEIFSILENNFLFGYGDAENRTNSVQNARDAKPAKHSAGKVRILCIDGAGATDGILAAKSLAHLEACLRRKSGDANSRVADFFDAAAGSGVGGVLAALLFTRGKDGQPLFTAEEALRFLSDNRRRISCRPGILRRVLRPESKAEKLFRKTFGECTLRDTVKPVLIPCYDLVTRAPFVFSRADALEMDGYDFKMSDIAGEGASDMICILMGMQKKIMQVDQAVSMAFGDCRMSNYVRIQSNGVMSKANKGAQVKSCKSETDLLAVSEEMLSQKNVESVLFKGKKVANNSNLEKLELFGGEIIKEGERRKNSILPTVVLKNNNASPSPSRTSSATTLSTLSSNC
ncbi:Patatin-like protein [Vigna angularis]|uniref:Patatin n=1 Tax=Phaseolus angularis TaxID=3914 RepID=A0A8T0KBC9_PHAAN|nr:Patatin-like protein [Vigna angularis]